MSQCIRYDIREHKAVLSNTQFAVGAFCGLAAERLPEPKSNGKLLNHPDCYDYFKRLVHSFWEDRTATKSG